jgi:hypothetical protein
MTIRDEMRKKKVDFSMTTASCPVSSLSHKAMKNDMSSSNKSTAVASDDQHPREGFDTSDVVDQIDLTTFSCENQKRKIADNRESNKSIPTNLTSKKSKCQEKKAVVSPHIKKSISKKRNQSDGVVPSIPPLIPCRVYPSCKSTETKILNSVRFVSPSNDDVQSNQRKQQVTSSRQRHQLQGIYSFTTIRTEVSTDSSGFSEIEMPSAARFPSGSSPMLSPSDYCFYLRHHTLPAKDSSSSDASSSDSDTDVSNKQLRSQSASKKNGAFPGSLSAASMDVPQVSELLTNLIQDMKETPASG